MADAKKAGELPFAHYAAGFIARQRSKVAAGKLKARTCERYEGTIKVHLLPVFGAKAVGAITVTDCEQFRANLLANRRPRTVRNVWQMLDRVLEYAYEHKAIGAVPTDVIDRSAMHYAVGDDTGFEPHPLSVPQVAALAAKVGERYEVYELLVLFMAYTGLRAAEVQGLEFRDLILTTGPDGSNTRVGSGAAHQDPPTPRMGDRHPEVQDLQEDRSAAGLARRPDGRLPGPRPAPAPANEPTAPLWPRRLQGNHVVRPPLDWSAPCDLNGVQSKIIRPALEAVGLPASRPAIRRPGWHRDARHQGRSAARPPAHGGGPVAYQRCPLHPGCEVARAQQLRVDADDVRRLHSRRGDGEPATGTCCAEGEDDERSQLVWVGTFACARSRFTDTTAALSH